MWIRSGFAVIGCSLINNDAYFAALKGLKRPTGTQVFLGLVHLADGLEGTRRGMATASRFIQDYGIGSECGMSGRPEGWTEEMLALHRTVAETA